jgi:hypothetical protein
MDELLRFADVLLPGDDLFPAASATGIAAALQRITPATAERIAAIEPNAGSVARFAAEHPAAFAEAQKHIYLAYYEQPAVIAAIRAMGITYNPAPLPEGYPLAPFDAAIDTPRHGRGRWIATADVVPADISHLDHLPTLNDRS